ncbi:N-terminal kinase-like protein isoform X1 [Bactrocera oleae]|uniref:N-terminal kinase-like protein isoform X1 n=1 Tax=Bactrocera oleae TaxID=104688 RepID=UPI0006B8324F|nr:N-terminal kinase-like protein isoform X1 [Bactrocera oleae]XP_036213495.1 N-terminal kinase-like protein isoform X1 [Bactrocera oleae]XP_036213496.1 N-terminal kinase-like protein isoform X1 [Bactrocera oleae]
MWSFFSRDSTKDFPYDIGEQVPGLESRSIWTLHKAKRKGTQEEVSVFVYDIRSGSDAKCELAKGALKRLKTLRHPSILQYLDSFETEKTLYIATEAVEALGTHIEKLASHGTQKDLYLAWGVFQITRALSFLNNDGNLRHNNVCVWSVFVNSSGEWKLGSLEYVSPADGNPMPPFKVPPALEVYDPPEKNDQSKLKAATKCSVDMWGLGCLVWESFNGPLKMRSNLKDIDNIPKSLQTLYCELVGASPSNRPNPADIITRCRKPGGFFKNDLVDSLLFLEEIQIKDKAEKNRFFSGLTMHLDSFPDNVCKHKILPQLITAYEYGDAGSAVLAPMFKLGKLLDEAEYQKRIVPCVVKLFASTDRVTRSRLLQQLELFIAHLQPQVVNDQIFPQVAHGFLDTNATIREQTVKSIIHLAPKLNYNNLNVEVLRHFARLQARDDQGGIRTNTTVCLGKIAPHLHPQVRQRVLVSAFIRAMRDPFPPARVAGVLALAATQQYFLLSEVANRVLPSLCSLTVDPEKTVRDPAFKTIRGFLGKLEKVSEDPSLRETMEADVHTATPSIGNAAATWAGWAVTAVTAKFYRSQSDSSRPRPPLTGRNLSKPASLEQPSSSSLSTTTSSVTSMTSLEHESNDTSASASDYGNNDWDNENWGEMDTSQDPSSPMAGTSNNGQLNASNALNEVRDGWDNEEWGSLEEEPGEEEEEQDEHSQPLHTRQSALPVDKQMCTPTARPHQQQLLQHQLNELIEPLAKLNTHTATSPSPSRGQNQHALDMRPKDISNIAITQTTTTTVFSNCNNISPPHINNSTNSNANWNSDSWADGEFEPVDEQLTGNTKLDEARRKREEKKLQRQRELEARRAQRTSGPMKLGAKKL